MEDSEPAEDGLLAGLRWNRSARDQVQLKHKIRDLPGLLKHGLHLRKKSVSISKRARTRPHVRPSVRPSRFTGQKRGFQPAVVPTGLCAPRQLESRLRCFIWSASVTVAVCVCVWMCASARARATSIITIAC